MKKKIVLIQDDKDVLEVMDEILEDEGFDVIPSLTTEPIKRIDKIDPDLVIVDDNIKGSKKGSKVIKGLKDDPQTEDLSAVLTSTSYDLPKTAEACKADDFIEKPFDIDHMINVVKKNS
ncbi:MULTISPECIES: response regulator [Chryseobacterium]|uniref:response regulator n=1 Tax=Chryseobacterium TaxID=59732 RepID=UPI001296FB35|nr:MULTISPECIES: response regulator [Chryseobacterium]MDR6919567.1 CheY-like chemotaxis protein [Chryseobacterium sp. 2987]